MDTLSILFSNDMKTVEALLSKNVSSGIALIPNLSHYLLDAGGKRIRPLLTLACAGLIGYEGDRHYPLAAAVECIHTATLLHDDVVDQAEERRGKSSARLVWGNSANVLVGDFLFSRAFQLMVETKTLKVLEILARASSRIAEGEVLQLLSLKNLTITEEHYFNIIERKTAELFAAACEVTGYLAQKPQDTCDYLRRLGLHLGLAFQLQDDLLDYTANADVLGKTVGKDFLEGKVTWPWLTLYQRVSPSEQTWMQSLMDNEDQRPSALPQMTQMMHKHTVFCDMETLVIQHTQRAEEALHALSGPQAIHEAFADILKSLTHRQH
jgi:octaprenyl-diphosphate synthase